LFFVAFFLLITVIDASATVDIEKNNSLVVVRIKDEKLSEVLNYLAERFGFALDIRYPLTERISTAIKASSLEEVIIKLLSLYYIKNYSIHFDSQGNIKGVKFYKPGSSTKPFEKTSISEKISKSPEEPEEEAPAEKVPLYEVPSKPLYLPPKSTY